MGVEMTRARPARERGVTLIEVLVSLSLLSFALLSVAPLFTGSVRTNASAFQLTNADTLAREKLEELSGYPRSDPRLIVPDGANAAVPTGVTTTGAGSVVAVNGFCDNDLPAWFHPSTGQTSGSATSPGAGWYAYPYSRTYTVEQFGQDMTTRIDAPAPYFIKLVTVTVQATRGPFPGLRKTSQSLYLRLRNES
jgi:prepilin-type N-terminal cleavage/methylation domain-containing protein